MVLLCVVLRLPLRIYLRYAKIKQLLIIKCFPFAIFNRRFGNTSYKSLQCAALAAMKTKPRSVPIAMALTST
jgi:hypothetical protein